MEMLVGAKMFWINKQIELNSEQFNKQLKSFQKLSINKKKNS